MRCPYCEEYDVEEEEIEEMEKARGELCPFCHDYHIPEEDNDE